jgi:hypothetical protein
MKRGDIRYFRTVSSLHTKFNQEAARGNREVRRMTRFRSAIGDARDAAIPRYAAAPAEDGWPGLYSPSFGPMPRLSAKALQSCERPF